MCPVCIGFLAIVAGFGIYKILDRSQTAINSRNIDIRSLTDDRLAVGFATISADSNWIAYGKLEGEASLRVKQVTTGSEVTVVPAQPGFFGSSATFTRGGNYLYYIHTDPTNFNAHNIYAAPSLGGRPRLIVKDVASGAAFSPDEKNIVYWRTIDEKGEDQILIADADGNDEHIIVRHDSGTKGLTSDPSWSGTSNLICIATHQRGTNSVSAILVLTPDGRIVKTFSVPMFVSSVAWIPGSLGILFIGAPYSSASGHKSGCSRIRLGSLLKSAMI